ncbi:MAG TPA: DUF5362 domain-containing protein [Patescibacteria group bacterium]|nr:DUF5362 domain-containing protein [Patescibacteria group bacterium]
MANEFTMNDVSGQSSISTGVLIEKMANDMAFFGIWQIVVGAFTCLSIVGAIIGVPTIIGGLRLRDAAEAFRGFAGSQDQNALAEALEKQSRFFSIQKILVFITIAFFVLMMVFYGAVISMVISQMPNSGFQP